jgi:hypothetical protein
MKKSSFLNKYDQFAAEMPKATISGDEKVGSWIGLILTISMAILVCAHASACLLSRAVITQYIEINDE